MKRQTTMIGGLFLLAVLWGTSGLLQAEVKLPAVIGSNMVLQRDLADTIWGKASPGEAVTVAVAGQSKTTKADSGGNWSLKLDPMKAGGPYTMTVKGENEIKLENVMVGEVWLCSGQSNMQMSVKSSNDAAKEIAEADYPNIRLLTVPAKATEEPQDDFKGEWRSCSPNTVGHFSAAAYFFARKLQQELGDVAIGLIHSSWGGASCEAWIRKESLQKDADWEAYLKRLRDLEKMEADKNPNYRAQHKPYYTYNAMIHPIEKFGIRGVIWYQGETNSGRAYQYRTLFPLLIADWRDIWQQGDFPFYFVQLANFQARKPEPGESNWAELREAQSMTLRVPNTGQAVIIDIGEADDIHPKNKQDVGYRLALWALAKDYGKTDLVYSGPVYQSMKVDGDKVTIAFDHVGGGLVAKDGALKGFAVAGQDKKFFWADAKIVGDTVVVSSKDVPLPVAVRYAWANNPECNLYNKADLPASPFRTDDWPGVTFGKK